MINMGPIQIDIASMHLSVPGSKLCRHTGLI